jgi:putative ABC transport system permease protein
VWMFNLLLLAEKQILRHPVRSLLTVLGVITGMFLFTSVETMQAGMQKCTETTAKDNILVVYRKNRFCPFTSNLPEYYFDRIKKINGVKRVIPIKVIVSNCEASLDVITFRGIRQEDMEEFEKSFKVLAGSVATWHNRTDAAVIGEELAKKRSLKVGDTFESAGVIASVAAIMESDNPQDKFTSYVHLSLLQRSSNSLGYVTQYNIKTDGPSSMKEVAKSIDSEFKNDREPTHTRSEKEFISKTANELIRLIAFTRYVGLAAVCTVLMLVANSIALSVRGRIKENAILQTIGYGSREISYLVIIEGVILGGIGGAIAIGIASLIIHFSSFTLGNEGVIISFEVDPQVLIKGMIISLLIGLFAGLFPAIKATRQKIVASLRMLS